MSREKICNCAVLPGITSGTGVSEFSRRVLEACEVRPGLYVLHPEFERVNFYSQQLRVLALVAELSSTGRLPKGARNVAVVGAGIAGLTAAAALATMGAAVTVYEEEATFLSRYRDANHRELHPNISAWPFQPLRAITNLPFLNWCCHQASEVRGQIKDEWDDRFGKKIPLVRQAITRIESSASGVVLSGPDFHAERDLAVVTVGFLEDMITSGPPQNTYWHSATMPARSIVTVSGVGDGGLIDVATQFYGHKTVDATRALAHAVDAELAEDVRMAEGQATELAVRAKQATDKADQDRFRKEAQERLAAYYPRLRLGADCDGVMSAFEINEERHVNVYYRPSPSPYRPLAAPINKVMLAYCIGKFETQIECVQGQSTREPTAITFNPPPGRYDPAHVLVRHGDFHAAYSILGAENIAVVEDKEKRCADLLSEIVEDEYDEELYVRTPVKPFGPKSSNDFVADVEPLLFKLLSHCDRGRHIQYRAARDEKAIVLHAKDGLPAYIRSMFPITVYDIEIRFGESGPFTYPAVPSLELKQ